MSECSTQRSLGHQVAGRRPRAQRVAGWTSTDLRTHDTHYNNSKNDCNIETVLNIQKSHRCRYVCVYVLHSL